MKKPFNMFDDAPLVSASSPKRIMRMSVKCSDMFSASFEIGDETMDYSGYVPDFMPDQHYGDYVMLDIDLDTGTILNWKRPSATTMKKFVRDAKKSGDLKDADDA